MPYWINVIAPSVKSGKRVVVAAHGNSLRALGMIPHSFTIESKILNLIVLN